MPLWISADLTMLSANNLTTLTNAEIIAVDQDPMCITGKRVSRIVAGSAFIDVWARPLNKFAWAIVLMNSDTGSHAITATWDMFSKGSIFSVRDLFAHSTLGTTSIGITATVASHDVAMYLLTPNPNNPLSEEIRIQNSSNLAAGNHFCAECGSSNITGHRKDCVLLAYYNANQALFPGITMS